MNNRTTENAITTTTATAWTTAEELLLACAVQRHGFKDWETISMEIQRRSSLPQILTTPNNCKIKYLDLKRRFTHHNLNDAVSVTDTVDAAAAADDDAIPWLEELRKLRVAELRQEVNRYDESILSLQLKVKRLEEEREQSLKESGGDGVEKPDLEKNSKEHGSENDNKVTERKPDETSPERVVGKSVSGEESDRENQSVNESNSTGPKGEMIQPTGLEKADKVIEPDVFGSRKLDDSKPVGEDSSNESSDSIAKGLTTTEAKPMKTEPDSSDLRDSVSESKRGRQEGTKESSDVQSSASLSRRNRRKSEISGGGSGRDEHDAEAAASRAIKQISVKSQPLAGVMDLIRSHKYGALFERRLISQETEKYNSIVRQHIDLRTIQKRLEEGSYSSCTSKFYRDLLLLFNNAIVFFPKSSVESDSASQLRNLLLSSNEMSNNKQTHSSKNPSPALSLSLSPPNQQTKSKSDDPEKLDDSTLLAKHKSSAPIIVCRKRSSISTKAAAVPSSSTRKGEKQNEEKKAAVDVKPPPAAKSSANLGQDQSLMIVTGTRSLRRSNTTLKNSVPAAPSTKYKSTSPVSNKKENPKTEKNKKEVDTSTSSKKRGAADFLKRIKGGNSSLVKSKDSPNDSNSKSTRGNNGVGGREQKQKLEETKDGRKERASRQKQAKEETSPSKRNIGRPTRKAAADLVTPGKRGREAEVAASKRPKKRSRR